MADVIHLSERGGLSSSYRLYDVGCAGREGPGRFVQAKTDVEAKVYALALLSDHPIELWDRKRFIARFWPGSIPLAVSVRVLN
ncbi:hypothetical protein [Methylobacterium sp. R2-1]|uniref:hypothetical protein n=1 Tax=Methylobacterium sp. R2-1 TaxID=2587064 RepID=UPI0016185480|nr:hypothetical protein [Methylobacterium sp. R2-1]MBB2961793.1 hypothetical protein [Methylobacterium sp. R2-1]